MYLLHVCYSDTTLFVMSDLSVDVYGYFFLLFSVYYTSDQLPNALDYSGMSI